MYVTAGLWLHKAPDFAVSEFHPNFSDTAFVELEAVSEFSLGLGPPKSAWETIKRFLECEFYRPDAIPAVNQQH